MNIIIVTQQDPFYLPVFFREFLATYNPGTSPVCVAGVVLQRALGKKHSGKLLKQMLDFYGPRDLARQVLRFIALRLADEAFRLGLASEPTRTATMVARRGIPLLPFIDVNSPECLAYVRSHDIHLIVSVAASQIFRKEILSAPPYGCVNLHNAPLPKYRGMLPNFWQMYHGEEYSVLTIHRMEAALDRGDIIRQEKTKIETGMSLDDLIRATKKSSAQALWRVLRDFEAGAVEYQPLPDVEGSKFSFPTREDVKRFRALGKKLI